MLFKNFRREAPHRVLPDGAKEAHVGELRVELRVGVAALAAVLVAREWVAPAADLFAKRVATFKPA